MGQMGHTERADSGVCRRRERTLHPLRKRTFREVHLAMPTVVVNPTAVCFELVLLKGTPFV